MRGRRRAGDRLAELALLAAHQAECFRRTERLKPFSAYVKRRDGDAPRYKTAAETLAGFEALAAAGYAVTIEPIDPTETNEKD